MKAKTFNISLPDALIKRADALAKKEYRSRSELIKEALRGYVEEEGRWETLIDFTRTRRRGVPFDEAYIALRNLNESDRKTTKETLPSGSRAN